MSQSLPGSEPEHVAGAADAQSSPSSSPRASSHRVGIAVELGYCGALLLVTFGDLVLDQAPMWILVPKTFLPYLYAPMLLLGLFALVKRRARRHAASLMLALVFVMLYGRQLLPKRHPAVSTALSVMSYNVQRESRGTQALLHTISAEHPQLLALQEVRQPDDARAHLLPTLQDLLGYQCEYRSYFAADTAAGMAVCVSPELSLDNVQRRTYHKQGQWSYLFAELHVAQSTTVNVIVPHLLAFRISDRDPRRYPRYTWRRLGWATHWHHQETNELIRLIEGFRDPTIIAGDFNSTPEQLIHYKIRRSLTDAFRQAGFGFGATYRFVLPLRIDYIYVSSEIAPLAAWVGPPTASDHRPVIALVDLGRASEPLMSAPSH